MYCRLAGIAYKCVIERRMVYFNPLMGQSWHTLVCHGSQWPRCLGVLTEPMTLLPPFGEFIPELFICWPPHSCDDQVLSQVEEHGRAGSDGGVQEVEPGLVGSVVDVQEGAGDRS